MDLLAELLEDAFAPRDAYGRRLPMPPPPDAVSRWPAPRGERGVDGRWRWTLATRPPESFVSDLERRSVEGYRQLAAELVAARTGEGRGISLRRVASDTGVALSVLTAMETGSAWPNFQTMAVVAHHLGYRVEVAGPRAESPDRKRVDPAYLERWWVEAGAHPALPWQLLVGEELLVRMEAAGLTRSGLARKVGLRHNTVTDIYRIDRFRFLNVRTLSALCASLTSRLTVVPADAPR